MRRRAHPILRGLLLLGAAAAVLGGVALEGHLLHATTSARATLLEGVAREPDLSVAATHARQGRYVEAAAALSEATERKATSAAHALASRAAEAVVDFPLAARHATFAARLAPKDESVALQAEAALDRALLARLRPASRVLGTLGVLVLGFSAMSAVARRRRRRLLARWLANVQGSVHFAVDGGTARGAVARLSPETAALAVDLHLQLPPGRMPRPGPTLQWVLSQASSSSTLRLTPVRDVQQDAVRVRLKDDRLRHVLARPGTWRLRARLGGREVAEARLDVAPSPPSREAPGVPPRTAAACGQQNVWNPA